MRGLEENATAGSFSYYYQDLMSQSRNFVFTMNNYEDTKLVDELDCRYIIYGKEVGASGTPHLQGAVVFKSARRLPAVIKKMPGCHVEMMHGRLEQAVEYCMKDGDWTERGDKPKSQSEKGAGEKRRWKEIREAAEEGRYEDIDDEVRFKYDQNIERIRSRALKARKLQDTETQHEWYWGDSGTGKSRKARTENPEAYLKMCNKWWDGYTDQETVIIEDLDKKHDVLCHHLKIWGDRYPFPGEMKGSGAVIRPKKIIVTSNYHPSDIWFSDSDLQPILRRFKCVEFKTLIK